MRCLVVRQPWAELIACGRKTVEVRTWTTHYRGPLVILAAARVDASPHAQRWPGVGSNALGCAVAIVELNDVRQATPRDSKQACVKIAPLDMFSPPTFSWLLGSVRRTPCVQTTGKLGLYACPADLAAILSRC